MMMMRLRRLQQSLFFIALFVCFGVRADDLNLPRERIAGGQPGGMMQSYWMRQVDQATQRWKDRYEKLKTPEDITAYQQQLREVMLQSIGGLPEPTPLEPLVTSMTAREGYRVEKVLFQSQPGHYVSALFFLPEAVRFAPPYPGVLVPCGHAMAAKAYPEYQSMGALLALNGMAALVFDPIDQGERGQYLGEGGWPKLSGTRAHSMVGAAAILLGRNTARFEIWDAMRALDYLQSRPEVDPKRIGCTGNSGGGTQTSYLMALDDRIQVAAPSCYICGFPALLHTIGPQDAEQNLFGQVAAGLDHTDYILIRAPRPLLVCAATRDFFDIKGTWDVFRYAKRLYTRMGFPERVDLMENDAGHNYNASQREAVARWMSRWLLGKDQVITEPKIQLLDDKEVLCAPEGLVMRLPGARSVYDLNQDYEDQLAPKRAAAWSRSDRSELWSEVRRLAGVRRLNELRTPQVESIAKIEKEGFYIEQLLLAPEEGIWLPALRFVPAKPNGRIVLYVHDQGKAAEAAPGGAIHKRVEAGDQVLAVDLRGTGQTQPEGRSGGSGLAYLLGRSYAGARAEDILVAARFASELNSGKPSTPIELFAIGNIGIPALHAAALEPQLFAKVNIARTLRSWSDVIRGRLSQNQSTYAVHGALTVYDLPDLAQTLGDKLVITDPVDGRGRPFAGR
jgi:cephalosporin-C deacetylase-like acetyl esterase